MTDLYLGIYIGTTGTKSVVLDGNGNFVGKGYKGYPLSTPFEGAFEQNPEAWYDALSESVRIALHGVDGRAVKALSFSAQGGSFFAAKKTDGGKLVALTDAYTWMDVRATEQFERISEQISSEEFYQITGWRLSPSSMFCRLLWLKENLPEIFESAEIFLTTSDYAYYRLTGEAVIDHTSAAMTGLFDIKSSEWSDRLVNIVGLSRSQLPRLMKTGEKIGKLLPEQAEKLSLSTETKVLCGVHDQYAAAIASNTVNPNDVLISTGTTWVVFGKSEKLRFTESYLSPCPHPTGGYGVIGSAVSSGTVIEWLKGQFGCSFEELNTEAKKRDAEKGLFVYPFVSGCGEYREDKDVSAAILGLSFRHDKFDVIRAAMEGVAFEIKFLLSEFEKAGVKAERVKIAGGAANSRLWMEILASVLGRTLFVTEEKDICPIGAAAIALGDTNAVCLRGGQIEPNAELVAFYQEKYVLYRENEARAKNITKNIK